MNTHIKLLEDKICDCVGPWGSLLSLAAEAYQGVCKYIKELS